MQSSGPDQRPFIDVAFIADTHLFLDSALTEEFKDLLKSKRFGAFFMNGDFLALTEQAKKAEHWQTLFPENQPVSEGVYEVFDLINRARLEDGTKFFFMAGNHDNGFRPLLDGRNWQQLRETEKILGMDIVPPFDFEAADGRNYTSFHGDNLNSKLVRRLYEPGDALRRVIENIAGRHATALVGGFFKVFENAKNHLLALQKLTHVYNSTGVIYGHTHMPGHWHSGEGAARKDFFNVSFMDGDAHVLTFDKAGEPALINWSRERAAMPAASLGRETGAERYRALSRNQVAHIQANFHPLPSAIEDRYAELPALAFMPRISQTDLRLSFNPLSVVFEPQNDPTLPWPSKEAATGPPRFRPGFL